MEEDGEDISSPFWVPSSGNKRRRNDRIIHGLSSLIFNSGLLVLILLVTALSFFLIFVVPSTLSFSAQIYKPNSVKKSWDSLNLILVVVALLLGFLCRNKNEEMVPDDDDQGFQASTPVIRNEYRNGGDASKSNQLPSPRRWYDYSDQNRSVYSSSVPSRDMFLRTSTSYPDLRQVPSSQQMEFSDDPWRFSDDINWATGTGQLLRRRSWKDKDKSDDVTGPVRFSDDIYWGTGTGQRLPSWKEKTVETTDLRSDKAPIEINSREPDVSSLIPPPPAPLPPPLPVMTSALPEEKLKRTNGDKRGRNRRRNIEQMESMEPISPVVAASPPPPPPPPPPPMPQFLDPKSSKRSLKKRSGGGSATKDFLNSLYHKKKKKQRQKSIDNFDSLVVNRYQQPPSSQPPPPPPPPPPVSPPVSYNRSARKKKDAVISASSGTTTSQFLTVAVNIPPKAAAVSNYYGAEESSNSGGESPVIHIPPPPPPPPSFSKSLAWKFALQGDYVRVDSTASSRSVSPEPYDADSDRTPMAGDATPMTTASSFFCPSPDVDTKADKFISNFWAGLKLEKINSLNKKQGLGLSNLGPGPGPTQR